tara:strand:+ start:679 stop:1455 length:777 start_codon:yes stop_codon:yes gene_type:complete
MRVGPSGHYAKERERVFGKYEADLLAISEEEKGREAKEAIKAQKAAVKMKAGETLHDLLQKGYHTKTKSIMDNTAFKDAKWSLGGDDLNMYTTASADLGAPGVGDLLGYETVEINPEIYRELGEKLIAKAQPAAVGNMSSAKLIEEGRKFVAEGGDYLVLAAESKLAEKLGTWGKIGKYLGPVGVALQGIGGLQTMSTSTEADEQIAGGMQVGGAAMIGGGMVATAAGVGLANWWNPVGWGIGAAGSLYGLGKSIGLL